MLMKQLSKNKPEQVTIVVKNVDAATMSTGLGVALQTGTSCDGINAVINSATTNAAGFVGISRQDIPVNGYGTVVCWGVADSILLSNVGTSITIGVGNVLWPSGVAGQYFSTTPSTALSTYTVANLVNWRPYVVATSSITISAAAYVSGFVRAI